MKSQGLKVSVVIPAFNAERYIKKGINSVLWQSHANLEILIVDDCSTDSTARTVEEIARRDARIVLVSNETNRGVSASRNRGIELSTGDYVAFLDADDLWHPLKIQSQLEMLIKKGPEYGVCYCSIVRMGEDDSVFFYNVGNLPEGDMFNRVLEKNYFQCGSTFIVRRDLLTSVGMFDPAIQGAEDWDLSIKLAAVTKFAVCREPLCGYRRGRYALHTNALAMLLSGFDVLKKHEPVYGYSAINKRMAIRETVYALGVKGGGVDIGVRARLGVLKRAMKRYKYALPVGLWWRLRNYRTLPFTLKERLRSPKDLYVDWAGTAAYLADRNQE